MSEETVVKGKSLVRLSADSAQIAIEDGGRGLFRSMLGAIPMGSRTITERRHSCYSTFLYSNGETLAHTYTNEQHRMWMKVPDMTFVGRGMWIHKKDARQVEQGKWIRK